MVIALGSHTASCSTPASQCIQRLQDLHSDQTFLTFSACCSELVTTKTRSTTKILIHASGLQAGGHRA